MEKKSTPRADLLPRATNLATLATVVAAMWWSGAQRPEGLTDLAITELAVTEAAAASPSTHAPARQQLVLLSSTTTEDATAAVAAWPAQATAMVRDGLQAVGYQTRSR